MIVEIVALVLAFASFMVLIGISGSLQRIAEVNEKFAAPGELSSLVAAAQAVERARDQKTFNQADLETALAALDRVTREIAA